MRLSEERIYFIVDQIIESLLSKQLIETSLPKNILRREIAKVFIKDLKIEDEIEEEVIRIIKSMSRDIPEDSPEWQSIFRQKKEELAQRRNYIF